MSEKIIQNAEVCSITLLNAKKVNEYNWISASNGSLDGESIIIFVVFDRDTEDYYLHTNNSKVEYFSINQYNWPLDEGLNSFAKLIASKIRVSNVICEKCIFAARALIEDEADDIDEMEFEYTFDNELGDINPEIYFSDKDEVLDRVWMNISKTKKDIKVKLDASSGSLKFDREALDDIKVCAWSKFRL